MKETPCTPQWRKGLENPNEILSLTIFICVCGQQNSTDFYVENKIVPTCNKLIPITCEKIQSPWGGEQSLRSILHTTGMRWRKQVPRRCFPLVFNSSLTPQRRIVRLSEANRRKRGNLEQY